MLHGADCNTDHKLLRLTVGWKLFHNISSEGSCKRFDIKQLYLNNQDSNGNGVLAKREIYCRSL